jgi:hypothetical protein
VQAAGGGWLAVSYFGGGMTALAAMVCGSLVSYALICVIVMGSDRVARAAGLKVCGPGPGTSSGKPRRGDVNGLRRDRSGVHDQPDAATRQ